MLIIFPVFGKIGLLPYFLKYYDSIGATRFICALYQGKKNRLYEEIASYKAKYEITVESSTNCKLAQFSARPEAVGLNRIRERYVRGRDWYCVADLDEFHYFGGGTLPEVTKEAQRRGYSAVHGFFIDRIAQNGSLPPIGGILDRRFPLASNLSAYIGSKCDKIALAKSHVAIARGHHSTRANTWCNIVQVHHFKWNDGVAADILDRHHRYMRQGMRWANRVYPRTYLTIKDGINLRLPGLKIWPAAKLGI